MTAVIIICLVYMALLLAALVAAYFFGADDGKIRVKSRSAKLQFLKSFKKGKFALITSPRSRFTIWGFATRASRS